MDYPGKVITKTQVTPTQTSASGNWTLDDQAAAIKNNNWPVALVPNPISKSLRFNSADTAYLNRTPATATNRRTWTWSAWVKRSALGSEQMLFEGGTYSIGPATEQLRIFFTSGDALEFNEFSSSAYQFRYITTQVFRDVSAWYHIVCVLDTTNSIGRIYLNGSQVTVFSTSTAPALNFQGKVNSVVVHSIGRREGIGTYLNGYMTEVNFIDGQALTPSSFGMTNPQTGQWIPLKYSGTYGTNGFYLNFKDATSTTTLGYDYSGNANNWTTNNFSVTAGAGNDSLTDVPTPWFAYNTTGDVGGVVRGNYCTLNPLAVGPYATLSDGNLKISGASATDSSASYSTIGMTTGKWYFEVINTGSGYGVSTFGYALVADVLNAQALLQTSFAGYRTRGNTYGTVTSTFATWEAGGEVIGVAVDCDNGAIYFARNNTWINSGDPTSGASKTGAITTYTGGSKTLYGGGGAYSTSSQNVTLNFGQRPFAYTPPTGFRSLCTTNLPATAIGFGLTNQGDDYFTATLYAGSASQQIIDSNLSALDLAWIKNRTTARDHVLVDTVRGGSPMLTLYPNQTYAEDNSSPNYNPTSITGGSITLGGAKLGINNAGENFVMWGWKAGGTGVTNTAGTITSTVSASTTSGFSIATFTGIASAFTFGHGLGTSPAMVFVKYRNAVGSWLVYHQSLPATYALVLNTTAAQNTAGTYITAVSSTTVSIGTGLADAVNFVAYCFAAVPGYSAFGSYTGNGSADGPFVYLGFRPKWVMVKSSTSIRSWIISDGVRNPYNVTNLYLLPNLSDAEATNNLFDFTSNGFKVRDSIAGINESSQTFIYAAFAESPFQFSNAR